MKKVFFILIAMIVSVALHAQVSDTSHAAADTSKFMPVDQQPEFSGGFDKFLKYLEKNLKYPKEAKDNNIQGRVNVSFVIERDGSLTNIKVVRSLSPETDAEAIRLMTNSPKWIPGMQGGRPVRVQFSLPIVFSPK